MEQAKRVSEGRAAARMSQEHLAKAAGVSVRTVIRAEGGRSVSPESIRAIGAVLGLDAADLPVPYKDSIPDRDFHADLVRGSDGPVLAADIRLVAAHVADAVPGASMVLRTDVVDLRRAYAQSQGLGFDPASPKFMVNVSRLWLGMYAAVTGSILTASWAWDWYVRAIQPPVQLYLDFIQLLLMFILVVATTLAMRESGKQLRSSRTVFAVDATHIHQFRVLRHAHLPGDTAAAVHRTSTPLMDIVSVRRTDAGGTASFRLSLARGSLDLPCICSSASAGEFERAIGAVPLQRRAKRSDRGLLADEMAVV